MKLKRFISIFSKVHMAFATFALLNIIFALFLRFTGTYFSTAAAVHFFAGLLIFAAPLILIITMKEPKLAWKALEGRLFIRARDKGNKKLLVAKITAWAFLVCLAIFAVAGIFIKSGLGSMLLPGVNLITVHMKGVYLLPPLLVLHVVTMIIAYGRKKGATI
ncbi:MAG: hypothetical protein HGA22_10040 [Clostridiales bacterium]|nr:hypothetical protein [Clostridiales bacterium]